MNLEPDFRFRFWSEEYLRNLASEFVGHIWVELHIWDLFGIICNPRRHFV